MRLNVSPLRQLIALAAAGGLAACAPAGTPAGAQRHLGTTSEGFYWTTCVDTLTGFVELANFSWGESVRAGAGQRCSDAPVENSAERGFGYATETSAPVRFWLGDGDRIELLAKRGPTILPHPSGACPVSPSRAAFAATAQTLEEAAALNRFSARQNEALRARAAAMREFDPRRLWNSGSRGTHDDTEFYCAEISTVLSETSPEFPEELKHVSRP